MFYLQNKNRTENTWTCFRIRALAVASVRFKLNAFHFLFFRIKASAVSSSQFNKKASATAFWHFRIKAWTVTRRSFLCRAPSSKGGDFWPSVSVETRSRRRVVWASQCCCSSSLLSRCTWTQCWCVHWPAWFSNSGFTAPPLNPSSANWLLVCTSGRLKPADDDDVEDAVNVNILSGPPQHTHTLCIFFFSPAEGASPQVLASSSSG